MAQEKIEAVMRGYVSALTQKDAEKALSFVGEEADWVTPEGTFKGKKELKRYLTWMAQATTDLKITDAGIGIMVQGNKAFFEHVLHGTRDGMKWEVLAICAYEFDGEKIQHIRTVYDRLSVAKQAAKGWCAKRVVASVVGRAEKGLH